MSPCIAFPISSPITRCKFYNTGIIKPFFKEGTLFDFEIKGMNELYFYLHIYIHVTTSGPAWLNPVVIIKPQNCDIDFMSKFKFFMCSDTIFRMVYANIYSERLHLVQKVFNDLIFLRVLYLCILNQLVMCGCAWPIISSR